MAAGVDGREGAGRVRMWGSGISSGGDEGSTLVVTAVVVMVVII